jgi:hypothetical protein
MRLINPFLFSLQFKNKPCEPIREYAFTLENDALANTLNLWETDLHYKPLQRNIPTKKNFLCIKGAVSCEFCPLVFSMNRPHFVPEFTP